MHSLGRHILAPKMKYVPFTKTHELLRLADMAAVREGGVSLEEIKQAFGVAHRSAQRMTQALAQCFSKHCRVWRQEGRAKAMVPGRR